ncbi:MAG: hypothetical protein WAX41_05985 [Lactobacillus delbrueckii]|uniref:hypothetical protein n=1 Tax=Lactobacillus delbrueckii TaxID=1584 RepID=UPI00254AA8CC|nr:hypothetical protein [Lactobacillus delbrueckii]MDK8261063.1 hypothetical protein [Lactobacillus delbrueckii]
MKLKKGLAFSAVFMAIACLFKAGQPVAAASEKMATTKELKLAHVQSRSYKLARGRRYYYV